VYTVTFKALYFCITNWKILFLGFFYIIDMACGKKQWFSLEGNLYFSEVFHKMLLTQKLFNC